MLESMAVIWGIFFVLCIVTEAATMSLVAVWFMPGALLGLILSLFKVPVWVQVLLFLILSVVLLLSTRRLTRRLLRGKPQPTNADRVLGREALVTEAISGRDGTGQVKVLGQIWSARGETPEEAFAAGSTVYVKRIEGVRLIVAPAPQTSNV